MSQTPKIEIVTFEDDHVDELAEVMREADKREVADMSLRTPAQALRNALRLSGRSWAIKLNGSVVGAFGVTAMTLTSGIGRPWLLGSDTLVENKIRFLRRCKKHVKNMEIGYNVLENYVAVYNEESINWLKWLGFTVDEDITKTFTGAEFKRFWMEID